jgi:UDP-N-acetyl-D-glucosamine dehydrogenase
VFIELEKRLTQRTATVGVIGLGYVGLTLTVRLVEGGFVVMALDIDPRRIANLMAGISHIQDISDADLKSAADTGRFFPTLEFAVLESVDVIVICVPTPLLDGIPDTGAIEHAARKISERLKHGQLVVLESTTYPGTTEGLLANILEESGLQSGVDFFLGFSPERIDPGNGEFGLQNVPKVIGGVNNKSTDLMASFYESVVDRVVRVSSSRAAEMTKLLENTYRHVNIALANEMAMLCHELKINVWEIIEAAGTKPFGFQKFYPGPGWGGHCIPVDPAYLSWRVKQLGQTAKFVELAMEMNRRMPEYIVERVSEALGLAGKGLSGSRVLILGVSYKADVSDTRETPAFEIISLLELAGAEVRFHDPFVQSVTVGGRTRERVALTAESTAEFDVIILHTDHASYDAKWLAANSQLLFDTRNHFDGVTGDCIVRL